MNHPLIRIHILITVAREISQHMKISFVTDTTIKFTAIQRLVKTLY